MDLIFRGGTIVTDGLEIQADLGVTNGRVSHIGVDLQGDERTQSLDAQGRYLFPGAVELLAGVRPFAPVGIEERMQWITGLAAVGGVTTLVLPAAPNPGRSVRDLLDSVRPLAEANAYVDFGVHLLVSSRSDQTRAWIREAASVGVASLWIDPAREGNRKEDLASLVWAVLRDSGENLLAIAPLWDSLLDAMGSPAHTPPAGGPRAPATPAGPSTAGAAAFPPWLETQVVERLAAMTAPGTGTGRLLLRSISSRPALEALKSAREEGARLLAAASLVHLVARAEGQTDSPTPDLPCWPPIHGKNDQSALWFLLEEGLIPLATSATGAGESIDPANIAGTGSHPVETMALLWSLLFTEGVTRSRLSLGGLVQAVSGDPAKLAGLYPTKGSLMIGSDADVVVFNPNIEWRVGGGDATPVEDDTEETDAIGDEGGGNEGGSARRTGPFSGWSLQGAIEHVCLRGRPLLTVHEMVGEPGQGRLLERRLQVK